MYLFRIAPYGKRPLNGSHFANTEDHNAEPSLTYDEALDWIKKSGNIAIRLDNLVAFDIDRRPFDGRISQHQDYYRHFDTVVNFSPHGFHCIYDRTKINDDSKLQSIFESKYNVTMQRPKDVIHTGNAYVVVPPSRIKYDNESNIKSYYFLDYQEVINGTIKIADLQKELDNTNNVVQKVMLKRKLHELGIEIGQSIV